MLPMSTGQIDVMLTWQHRVDVFLDAVNGQGGRNSKEFNGHMFLVMGYTWRLLFQIACHNLGDSSIWGESQVFCDNGSSAYGLADDPLFGQRQGTMPRCCNGSFSDTLKSSWDHSSDRRSCKNSGSQIQWQVLKVLAACCLPQLLGHLQQMKKKSGSSKVKSKTYHRQKLGEGWKYHLGMVSDTCHCGINLV